MDHVTRATPFAGMVSCPKPNTWYRLQAHKIWRRFRDISGVWNSSMRRIGLTMPTYGAVAHLKVSTSRGQTVHKI